MKLKVGQGFAEFHCPGCSRPHRLRVKQVGEPHPKDWEGQPIWILAGTPTEPTIHPSIMIGGCHLMVTAGKIMFLADSRHRLAGKTVPMTEVE